MIDTYYKSKINLKSKGLIILNSLKIKIPWIINT